MGPPEKEVEEILEELEETLLRRIPLAYERTPDQLFDEFSALDVVFELEAKMKLRSQRR